MSSANTTPEGSTASIGSIRSSATISPTTLINRRGFGAVLQGVGRLAATAAKNAVNSAALAGTAALVALRIVDKRTVAATAATAALAAAARKGAASTAAIAGTAAIGTPAPRKDQRESAALAGTAAAAVAQRRVLSQRVTSAGNRRVTSAGNVRVVAKLA